MHSLLTRIDGMQVQRPSVMTYPPSWPGFVPAIHAFVFKEKQDVDARDKRGHDES
jgi:hypothetical protein